MFSWVGDSHSRRRVEKADMDCSFAICSVDMVGERLGLGYCANAVIGAELTFECIQ